MIRVASISDCKNLAVLSTQVWLHTYATEGINDQISGYVLDTFNEDHYIEHLKQPETRIYISVENDHLVGFVMLDLSAEFESPSNGFEIVTLYVQEHFQGSGIGSALLNYVRDAHDDSFWLSVWTRNTAAIGFYKHYGFKDIGSIDFILGESRHENRVLSHGCG